MTFRWLLLCLTVPAVLPISAAELQKKIEIEQKTQFFSVDLSRTRIIYDPDSRGSLLTVGNSNDYPFLVQSRVLAEDKKTVAPFVVSPPLFFLAGHQQSRLSVVRTGGKVPDDRETLDWLCVTGVPPEEGDTWAEEGKGQHKPTKATLLVQVKMSQCIRVLTRPSSVKGDVTDAAARLTWSRHGQQLKINNPSPFYIDLKQVSVGGQAVSLNGLEYISPFGSSSLSIPANMSGKVQWRMITDQGGESRLYESTLQ